MLQTIMSFTMDNYQFVGFDTPNWFEFRTHAWKELMAVFSKHDVSGAVSSLVFQAKTYHAHSDRELFLGNMRRTVDSTNVYQRYTSIPLFSTEAFYAPDDQPRLAFIGGDARKETTSIKERLGWIDQELSEEWYRAHGFRSEKTRPSTRIPIRESIKG